MFEDDLSEVLRLLDVREMDAMSSACSIGVAGSSAPATTSTGAVIAEIRSRTSQAPTASQHRAYPSAGVDASVAWKRATSSGSARENSDVNQRPTTVSAMASIPSVRTVRARCAHASGGPRYADVQERTSRSTRSATSSASAIPTIPPSETPQKETRPTSISSISSTSPCASASTVHGRSGRSDAPWPGWS